MTWVAVLESVHVTSLMGEKVRDVAFPWSSGFACVGCAVFRDRGVVRDYLNLVFSNLVCQSLPRPHGAASPG